MKCSIEKKDLQEAVKDIRKVVGKASHFFLETNPDKETLSIIVSSGDEFESYINKEIPAKKIKKGRLVLSEEVIDSILPLTGNKFYFDFSDDILKIKANIEAERFPEDIKFCKKPKIKGSSLKIPSKKVGILRKLLDNINFNILYSEVELSGIPIVIENNKEGLFLKLADTSHCVFYKTKRLVKKDFQIITDLENLKAIFSLLRSEVQLTITEALIFIEGKDILATIPTLQTGMQPIIMADKLITKDKAFKEKVKFNIDDFKNFISDMGSVNIKQKGPYLKIHINGNKIKVVSKSTIGGNKGEFDCKSNIKDLKTKIPLRLFTDLINSCSIGEEVTLQFHKDVKTYKMNVIKKNLSIKCLAPTLAN